MEDPREGPPPPPPEPEWQDIPSHVHHLTDDIFDEFVKEHDSVLVMFYAPCKLIWYLCTCLRDYVMGILLAFCQNCAKIVIKYVKKQTVTEVSASDIQNII